MLHISTPAYLAAFAIAFVCGTLWSMCFSRYIGKFRREACAHARSHLQRRTRAPAPRN